MIDCIKVATRSPFDVTITITWEGCFDDRSYMFQSKPVQSKSKMKALFR